jgi:hypothetical protein
VAKFRFGAFPLTDTENSVLASTAREPNAAVNEFDAASRERGNDASERLALRLRLVLFQLADRSPMDAAYLSIGLQ